MSDDQDVLIRRTQRVIRMVSELHRMGYQRLRMMPYIYPLAWRVAVGPADLFSDRNGAWVEHGDHQGCAVYSSATSNEYFDWHDAKRDTAKDLAIKFIQRYPAICSAGFGRDWAYAGWLSELLGVLEREHALPFVLEEDYPTPPQELVYLPLRRFGFDQESSFDLPPPVWPTTIRLA